MRIGIVVEGEAEFGSLPLLIPRIRSDHIVLSKVAFAATDPQAATGKAVKRLMIPIKALVERRSVDRVVVLTDREQRSRCAGELAAELREALNHECRVQRLEVEVDVVLKNRMYENWLIADLEALRAAPARFDVTQSLVTSVVPDRADAVDAMRLLKRAVKGSAYNKIEDSKRIMLRADPARIGSHSRSFRRFLRVVGNPVYRAQSTHP